MIGKLPIALILAMAFSGLLVAYGVELSLWIPKDEIKALWEEVKKKFSRRLIKRNKESQDRELLKSSVILKNLSLVRQETPLSADYIYESLMENSQMLRPMYGEMLTLYRSGRDEEAFKTPERFIGTKAAKNFALILSKLDKINPSELVEQMNIFQTMTLERRMTWAVRRAQRNSVILTTLAAISVFALLINFAVVVVFMDSINMISGMFN